MSFLINPYAFLAAGGDFEPIATVTVGSGGASSIEFTGIPTDGTYQHLQVRYLVRSSRSSSATDAFYVQYNNDTSSANYVWYHLLAGNGSGAYSSAGLTGIAANNIGPNITASSATANNFAAGVADIVDYSGTTKNKTIRWFGGQDQNGAGNIEIVSGLWLSTAAINKVKFTVGIGNFVQHSIVALYGIRS